MRFNVSDNAATSDKFTFGTDSNICLTVFANGNVSASGLLNISASESSTSAHKVLVRDNTTGKVFYTGSYGGGGGGGEVGTLQQVTDEGSITTNAITASLFSASAAGVNIIGTASMADKVKVAASSTPG